MAFRLAQNSQFAQAFPPVDHNAGVVTGDWVSVSLFNHFALLLVAADSADALTYTIRQATSNTGTAVKDLDFTVFYRKEDTANLTAVGVWSRQTQTAANTVAATAGSESQILLEFDAADMDADGGFNFVSVTNVTDPGNAKVGYGVFILTEPRYAQQITDSVLV